MIMPSQQGPTQRSGLSLPLHHSIHCIRCAATTNFNVNCLFYTTGSVHEFLFVKYKMKYFKQYFQFGGIMTPSGYSREFYSENREMKKVINSWEISKPGSRFPNPTHNHTRCVVAICDDCKSTFSIQQRNFDSFCFVGPEMYDRY